MDSISKSNGKDSKLVNMIKSTETNGKSSTTNGDSRLNENDKTDAFGEHSDGDLSSGSTVSDFDGPANVEGRGQTRSDAVDFSASEFSSSDETEESFGLDYDQLNLERSRNRSSLSSTWTLQKLTSDSLVDEVCRTIREHAKSSKEVMKLIEAKFRSTDRDKNGYIDAEEFHTLLKAILGGRQVSVEEAGMLLKRFKVDMTGNSYISYDEFVSFVSLDRRTLIKAAMKFGANLFKMAEEQFNGSIDQLFADLMDVKINAISLKKFVSIASTSKGVAARTMTPGELTFLIRFVDEKGFGNIRFDDFQVFLRKSADRQMQMDQIRSRDKSISQNELHDILDTIDDKFLDDSTLVVVDVRAAGRIKNSKSNPESEQALLDQGYVRLSPAINEKGHKVASRILVKRASLESFDGDAQAFRRARVTDIILSRSSSDPSLLTQGYTFAGPLVAPVSIPRLPAAKRRQNYVWIRRNSDSDAPILDMAMTSGNRGIPTSSLWTPPCRGYQRVGGDIDLTTKGKQYFLWYYKGDFVGNDVDAGQGVMAGLMARVREGVLETLKDKKNKPVDTHVLWNRYDRAGSGYLDRMRFIAMLSQMGINLKNEELEGLIGLLDPKDNGHIHKLEFDQFIGFNPAKLVKIHEDIHAALVESDLCSKKNFREWIRRRIDRVSTKKRYRGSKIEHGVGFDARMGRQESFFLDKDELERLLEELGVQLNAQQIDQLVGSLDHIGDELIDMDELLDNVLDASFRQDTVDSEDVLVVENSARALRIHLNNQIRARGFQSVCDQFCRKSGLVDGQEIMNAVRKCSPEINLSQNETRMIMQRVGNDKFRFAEFAFSSNYIETLILLILDALAENDSATFFQTIDEDGVLTGNSLVLAANRLLLNDQRLCISHREAQLLIDKFDTNGDRHAKIGDFVGYIARREKLHGSIRQAFTSSLLHEHEKAIGDPWVLYVLDALRKSFRKSGGNVNTIFRCFDPSESQSIIFENLHTGLRRLNIIPNDIRLTLEQCQRIFRCMDAEDNSFVTVGRFLEFLTDNEQAPEYQRSTSSSVVEPDVPSQKVKLWIKTYLLPYIEEIEMALDLADIADNGTVSETAVFNTLREYAPNHVVKYVVKQLFNGIDSNADIPIDILTRMVKGVERETNKGVRTDIQRSFSSDRDGSRTDHLNSSSLDREIELDLQWKLGRIRTLFPSPRDLRHALNKAALEKDGKVSYNDMNLMIASFNLYQLSRRDWNALTGNLIPNDELGNVNRRIDSGVLCSKIYIHHTRKIELPSSSDTGEEEARPHHSDISNELKSQDGIKVLTKKLRQCLISSMKEGEFDWRTAAHMFDKDGNGTISLRDLNQMLRSLGQNFLAVDLKRLAKEVFALHDGSSRVQYERFFASILDETGDEVPESENVDTKVREAIREHARSNGSLLGVQTHLKALDHNGTGMVSVMELTSVMSGLLGDQRLSLSEQRVFASRFDTDESGRVDIDDFFHFFKPSSDDIDVLIFRIANDFKLQSRKGLDIQQTFRQKDSVGSGVLSRREFRRSLEEHLIRQDSVFNTLLSDMEMRMLMDRFDSGSGGNIDYSAFLTLCNPTEIEMLALEKRIRSRVHSVLLEEKAYKKRSSKERKHVYRNAFKLFDTNLNGQISVDEFRDSCEKLGIALSDYELSLMFQRFDTSGEGKKLDYFEFVRFLEADESKTVALLTRAGHELRNSELKDVGVLSLFEKYERQKTVRGLLARHLFFSVCKEVHLPLLFEEIAALCDLFSDASNQVKYKEFIYLSLDLIQNLYSDSTNQKLHCFSIEDKEKIEEVNDKVDETRSSKPVSSMRKKRLSKLLKAVGQGSSRSSGSFSNIPGRCSSLRSYGKTNECPVCFYKISDPTRQYCEMCDSVLDGVLHSIPV